MWTEQSCVRVCGVQLLEMATRMTDMIEEEERNVLNEASKGKHSSLLVCSKPSPSLCSTCPSTASIPLT